MHKKILNSQKLHYPVLLFIVLMGTVAVTSSFGDNIALHKSATQSSTYGSSDASLAVDGNIDGVFSHGSVTHTNLEANPWWQVNLGSTYNIAYVMLYNRTDCCSERWTNAKITVLDENSQPVAAFLTGSYSGPNIFCNFSHVKGRYIKVELPSTQYLSLTEVEVYDAVNLALSKTATQSSTYGSANASLAVDGNTDGAFFHGSVTHTASESNPWWQVDLGDVYNLSNIVVHGRTDCCWERLYKYRLSLLDVNGTEVWFQNVDVPYGNESRRYFTPVGTPGRYVKIQLTAPNALSLAEVEVFNAVNLAQNRPATQSSTYGSADASRAVDGNTDGAFFNGSVTHTAGDSNPWWMVDLQSDHPIYGVEIFNRTDCCSDRLSNFTITKLDKDMNVLYSTTFTAIPNPRAYYKILNISFARYLKITLNKTDALSLAEVRVFGVTY